MSGETDSYRSAKADGPLDPHATESDARTDPESFRARVPYSYPAKADASSPPGSGGFALEEVAVVCGAGQIAYQYAGGVLTIWPPEMLRLAPPTAHFTRVLDGFTSWVMTWSPALVSPLNEAPLGVAPSERAKVLRSEFGDALAAYGAGEPEAGDRVESMFVSLLVRYEKAVEQVHDTCARAEKAEAALAIAAPYVVPAVLGERFMWGGGANATTPQRRASDRVAIPAEVRLAVIDLIEASQDYGHAERDRASAYEEVRVVRRGLLNAFGDALAAVRAEHAAHIEFLGGQVSAADQRERELRQRIRALEAVAAGTEGAIHG